MDAVFFDRDGVLNYDEGYTHKFKTDLLYDDSLKFLCSLSRRKIKIFILTNQSGIALNYFEKIDLEDFMKKMIKYYRKHGIHILNYYYCPHYPSVNENNTYCRDCFCRKPRPMNFKKCLIKYRLRPENCVMIGDRDSDIKPAKALGFKKLVKIDRQSNLHPSQTGNLIQLSKMTDLSYLLW
ncbi:HAD-IIIA family hydrolase [Amylibacter sp.]|nr:HAD-IIIA family hydrolase [Amylibacter sp.]